MAGSTKEFIPTKKQEACIFYEGGDLLVRGVAGSGKSLVIMKRAAALNKIAIEKGTTVRIAIFTFAKTLVKYTNALMDQVGLSSLMIKAGTLDSYCSFLYNTISKSPKFVLYDTKTKKGYAEEAIQKHLVKTKKDHRLYHLDSDFWVQEFKWIKEKHIRTSKTYIESDRTGRGGQVHMSQTEKAMAYELMEIYNDIIERRGLIDSEDRFNYVIDHCDEVPDKLKYDYILVDEAQDLSLARLMMAKRMTLKSITIAADQAQKIYNTSFSWQDIGINIKGQGSKTLGETFRSTRQIILLADSLLLKNKDRLSAYGEYTEPGLPDKDGPVPVIVRCPNAANERDLIQKTLQSLMKSEGRVIGILCRTHAEADTIISWLNAKSLRCEKVEKDSEWDLSIPGIKIMTLHSAKGLEVDTVIIPHFTRNIYPLEYVMDNCDPDQIDEVRAQERSLLYVGMTRARNELLITYSGMPSPFLNEMDSSLYNEFDTERDGSVEAIQFLQTQKESSVRRSSVSLPLQASKSETDKVVNGNTVYTVLLSDNSEHTFIINLKLYPVQASIVGKKVGDTFSIREKKYKISQIERYR